MHGAEMFVFGLDADDFFGNFDGVGILGVQTGYECIGFSCLYHHHAEVVAFEHLIVCLLIICSFTGTFLAQDACIAFAAFCFTVMTQVDDFDAFQA